MVSKHQTDTKQILANCSSGYISMNYLPQTQTLETVLGKVQWYFCTALYHSLAPFIFPSLRIFRSYELAQPHFSMGPAVRLLVCLPLWVSQQSRRAGSPLPFPTLAVTLPTISPSYCWSSLIGLDSDLFGPGVINLPISRLHRLRSSLVSPCCATLN